MNLFAVLAACGCRTLCGSVAAILGVPLSEGSADKIASAVRWQSGLTNRRRPSSVTLFAICTAGGLRAG